MMTPTPSQRESIAAALGSLLRVEVFMLLVWAMTLVYMILQDRADRQYAMERHQEVMESLSSTRATITQSVHIGTSRDEMVKNVLESQGKQ